MGAVAILPLSFAVGSVPTANIFARVDLRGVDLRDVGGGTVSGTSFYRVAGFVPLAVLTNESGSPTARLYDRGDGRRP